MLANFIKDRSRRLALSDNEKKPSTSTKRAISQTVKKSPIKNPSPLISN
jgi:hypothetical protein